MSTTMKGSKLGQVPLSDDFKVYEFACWCPMGEGCRGAVTIDDDLIDLAQYLRDYSGQPMQVTSGYRCAHRNSMKGGHPRSRHLNGMAEDLTSIAVRSHLDEYANAAAGWLTHRVGDTRGNVIIYRNRSTPFIHVDVGYRIGATTIREST